MLSSAWKGELQAVTLWLPSYAFASPGVEGAEPQELWGELGDVGSKGFWGKNIAGCVGGWSGEGM